ncbi:MAG: peptide ABC transporter substrate-binding protein [Nitrososphaerales archaeon]
MPGLRYCRSLLLLAAFCLSGCLPAARSIAPRATPAVPTPQATETGRGAGDTLTILYWQAPTVLNPHLAPAAKDRSACRIAYEPLASYNRDGNLVPFLAAEIPTLENGGVALDGRSVTWKLKQGVLWSDGKPFTAADVLFTYKFATNPAVRATTAGNYSDIQAVDAIDDYTVRITFKDVKAAWAQPFVGANGMVLPEHAFAGYPDPLQAPVNTLPIGTGPYRAVSFKPQEVLFLGNELIETNKIVFEPNPYFRDPEKPYFSQVVVKGGGTVNEAARSVFQVGDADFTHNLQLMDAKALANLQGSASEGRLLSQFGSMVERILINRTDPNHAAADGERSSVEYAHPFFSDLRVRRAFSLAIDREAIASLYGPAGRTTSNVLVSPEIYASPDTHYEYNLEKAAALLEEAGWVDTDGDGVREREGVRMTVVYQTSVDAQRQQAQAIVKKALESIGVEVKLKIVEASVFLSNDPANTGTRSHFYADLEQFTTGNFVPDPGTYMKTWTCGEIAQQANGWTGRNYERWCDPAYDELYAQSTRELDPKRRAQVFIEMNDMIIDDVVLVPVGHRAEVFGASNTLEGVDLTPWDADTWNIQDWTRRSPAQVSP